MLVLRNKGHTKGDSCMVHPHGIGRLKNVDIDQSLVQLSTMLRQCQNDKIHLRDYYIKTRLAFHLLKLLYKEVHYTLSDKGKMGFATFKLCIHLVSLRCKLKEVEAAEICSFSMKRKTTRPLNLPELPRATSRVEPDHIAALRIVMEVAEFQRPNVSLNAVIGQEKALDKVKGELITPFNAPHVARMVKKDTVCGLLFYGAPGNGKTMIAKAATSQASNFAYIKMKVGALMSKWSGQAQNTLIQLFKVARMNSPCIVFIDEVESLMVQRAESSKQSQKSDSSLLGVMLEECQKSSGIFIIAATNTPWIIDDAIYRRLLPVHIEMPNLKQRYEVLRRHFLNQESFLTTTALKRLAIDLDGASFDDIGNFLSLVGTESMLLQTDKAKAFKRTYSPQANVAHWTACFPDDPGAEKKTFEEVKSELYGLPMCAADVQTVMARWVPSVRMDLVQKYKVFAESGKKAVDELCGDDEKFEHLPNLNADYQAGKYGTKKRGSIFKFKMFSK